MHHFPAYPRKPHGSGQARIRIQGRDVYLGPWGSPASKREYARLAQLHAEQPDVPPPPRSGRLTVAGVLSLWLIEVVKLYKPKSREPDEYRHVARVLDRVAGHLPAADFDTRALSQVQAAMADGSWMNDEERAAWKVWKKPIGWCKNRVNRQITRIRTLWRWAEEAGHVPRGSWAHLCSLRPLSGASGRARDTEPREPVEWEAVKATLPHLPPVVAAMAELQWWTGMRPGEVCRLRAGDVDAAGETWTYTIPADQHKTGHRDGAARLITLGPEAQRVLRPWLEAAKTLGPDAVVFRPSRQRHQKTYTRFSYRVAVARACEAAKLPPWSPYQLRHAAKERITRELGLDAARVVLGQKSIGTTNLYAQRRDAKLAGEVARKTG